MPVNYVRVEGVFKYISKETLKQRLKPWVTTGFLSADMQKIHRAAVSLPWVAAVEVKRVWPDAIDIRMYEQKPAVRWGDNSLLNRKGELFTPANIAEFTSLPLINGPEGKEKKLLEVMKGLNMALLDQSLEMAEFHVSERRSWKLVLVNGMQIKLGRKEPLKNFQRLIKTLQVIGAEQVKVMATVDMRYPSGFAVSWKPETTINWKDVIDKQRQQAGKFKE